MESMIRHMGCGDAFAYSNSHYGMGAGCSVGITDRCGNYETYPCRLVGDELKNGKGFFYEFEEASGFGLAVGYSHNNFTGSGGGDKSLFIILEK